MTLAISVFLAFFFGFAAGMLAQQRWSRKPPASRRYVVAMEYDDKLRYYVGFDIRYVPPRSDLPHWSANPWSAYRFPNYTTAHHIAAQHPGSRIIPAENIV